MKRLFALLTIIILSASCAFAEIPDFSGMTDAEILNVINAGRNAIILETIEDGLYKLETEVGVTIVFTEIRQAVTETMCAMDLIIINDSDTNYEIRTDKVFVNGWHMSSSKASVDARRRMKKTWYIQYDEANISGLSEIEDIEIHLLIYPEDGSRTRDSLDIPPVIITFK